LASKIVQTDDPDPVYAKVYVGEKEVYALVDTGCQHCVVSASLIDTSSIKPTERRLVAANEESMSTVGVCEVEIRIGNQIQVISALVTEVECGLILGIKWIRNNGGIWDTAAGLLLLGDEIFQLYSKVPVTQVAGVASIRLAEDKELPPKTMTRVAITVVGAETSATPQAVVVEPHAFGEGVISARTVVNSANLSSSELVGHVAVVNLTDGVRKLKYGTVIGTVEKESPIIETLEGGKPDTSDYPHLSHLLDALPLSLCDRERKQAEEFIRSQADLFSRDEFDVGRTNLVQATIDTDGNKPFKQGLRSHPWAHLPLIDEHVEKMVKAGVVSSTSSP
jgi:predicted aspartyl protease